MWRDEMWADEMQRYLELRVQKDGGPAEFARAHGVNLSNLVQILEGRKPIPASIAAALGYEKRVVYVRPRPWEV